MGSNWSDNISITELSDEPVLSEELTALISRLDKTEKSQVPNVVLNFSSVTYVNSSNLAQLLRLRKRMSECGRQLWLCSVSDDVWSVILITGLDKVFRVAPDPFTALASLQIETAKGDGA
ncbi:MAG: STAS domain-containing protein [Planctomycetota bacterium]|nr:STAS domain-containing protein [Planctomycetota bacterium]